MPILHGTLTPNDGAFQTVRIGLTHMAAVSLRRSGSPVPPAQEVSALIDTGAEVTCIDPSVANRLGLIPKNVGLLNVPAVSGLTVNYLYDVTLVIPHPTAATPQQLIVPDLEVSEFPLNSRGCEALIGRDVLAYCVLIYDGLSGTFTLSY